MAKYGIGVGEEFPVSDPPPPPSPPNPPDDDHHRHRGWHIALHVITKIALFALVVGALVWLFQPHGVHGYFGPYAYYPAHHFFFPFFPILLLVLFLSFAFRRHRYWGHHHPYGYGCDGGWRRWHDEMHRERGERT
jgi:hypothetical protein